MNEPPVLLLMGSQRVGTGAVLASCRRPMEKVLSFPLESLSTEPPRRPRSWAGGARA